MINCCHPKICTAMKNGIYSTTWPIRHVLDDNVGVDLDRIAQCNTIQVIRNNESDYTDSRLYNLTRICLCQKLMCWILWGGFWDRICAISSKVVIRSFVMGVIFVDSEATVWLKNLQSLSALLVYTTNKRFIDVF